MKILFIANPTSPVNEKEEIEKIISEFSARYKFNWTIYYTKAQHNIENIQNKINEFEPALIIVSGGDGTINLVGKILLNSNIEMGIIPAGSANGLAYNLSIRGDIRNALQKIMESKSKPIDAIRINKQYICLHLCDVGINAQTVKRFEREKSKGILGYGKHMIKELWTNKPEFSFYLSTETHKQKFKAEMLVVANAKAYGTGATINQDGDINDGKFEIIIIKPYPWWSLFRLLKLLFIAKNHHLDFVKVISTSKADIEFSKPQDLQADGEMIESISAIHAEILPSALKIRY
jgi:diacylglycerol kinase (ATP)